MTSPLRGFIERVVTGASVVMAAAYENRVTPWPTEGGAGTSAPRQPVSRERRLARLDAGGRKQCERRQGAGIADRDLRRDPAAQAMSDQMNIAQLERLHQIEIEERDVADAHHPVRDLPAPEARMLRRQDAVAAAELVEQRIPRRPRGAVQEQHGRSRSGLAIAELRACDFDCCFSHRPPQAAPIKAHCVVCAKAVQVWYSGRCGAMIGHASPRKVCRPQVAPLLPRLAGKRYRRPTEANRAADPRSIKNASVAVQKSASFLRQVGNADF